MKPATKLRLWLFCMAAIWGLIAIAQHYGIH